MAEGHLDPWSSSSFDSPSPAPRKDRIWWGWGWARLLPRDPLIEEKPRVREEGYLLLLYNGFDGMQNWTLNWLALSFGQCLRASCRVVVSFGGEHWRSACDVHT